MTLLIFYLVIAIGFSFYCSVAEAVLLSVSSSFIATLRKSKPKSAERLAKMKKNVDRPLAAILSLNTIAHTIGAAGVGSQAATLVDPKYSSHAVGIASAVMTLLILVLSEIIPKTLGALYWRSLAPSISGSIRWLITLLFPLVWLSEQLTKVIAGGASHHSLTRDELAAMAEIGGQQGVLNDRETQVFAGLLKFPTIKVADIMTPRPVVIAFSGNQTVAEVLDEHPNLPVSRLPIHGGDLDQTTGFVLRSELLLAYAQGKGDQRLSEFRRDLMIVEKEQRLPILLDRFLNQRAHLSLVVDQYGTTAGVVSMEDLVETLLGLEIVDERDHSPDMQKLAREQWEKRATALGLPVRPKADDTHPQK